MRDVHAVRRKQPNRTRASPFRRHPKIDDTALIRLVYYFCNGVSPKAVADTLGLSRKSVRTHYLDLRTRLCKPTFRRWVSVYSTLPTVSDPHQETELRGAFLGALSACHYSGCFANYAKGNRVKRICRHCPLSQAFGNEAKTSQAVDAIDGIRALYKRLGIRGEPAGNKQSEFLERFIHASVIASVRQNSKRLPNGLLNPADTEFQAVGTLVAMLMDDLADDMGPRFDGPC